MRALFVAALAAGCRLGEVLALRWRDVDLEAGRLTVRHTLQRVEKEWVLAEPKTTRSVRRLMLPTFAVEALKRHHREQAERRLALGPEWKNALGLVFTTFDGNPLDPVNVTHALQRRLAKAKLPQQRFHDLRHATATFLLMQKVPVKLVAEQLGHSDVRLTQNTYQHVLDEVKRDVADNLEVVLGAAVGASQRPLSKPGTHHLTHHAPTRREPVSMSY